MLIFTNVTPNSRSETCLYLLVMVNHDKSYQKYRRSTLQTIRLKRPQRQSQQIVRLDNPKRTLLLHNFLRLSHSITKTEKINNRTYRTINQSRIFQFVAIQNNTIVIQQSHQILRC